MPQIDVRLPEYAEPYLRPAKYKSLGGGRGGAKSRTFAQIAVLRMGNYLPFYPPGPVRIASGREHQVTIRESVKQVIEYYIGVWGLTSEFDCRRDWIDNKRTGSHLWFPAFGQNPNAFRSTFKVDVLWIEEGQFLRKSDAEVILPSIFRDEEEGDADDGWGDQYLGAELWTSWNPMDRQEWPWWRFVMHPRPEDVHRLVTWRDNPWFPPGLEEERRAMQEEDPERYEHVWEGQPDDGDASKKVLSRAMLEACVEAFRRGLAPKDDDSSERHAVGGYDHADGGGASCSLTLREGPVIRRVNRWPGVSGDPRPAVRKAHSGCVEAGVRRLFYDANSPLRGIFLGVMSGDEKGVRYAVRPQHFGGEVLGPDVNYEVGRPNKRVFSRWNVQSAFALRHRAQRTVRLMRGDTSVNPRNALFIDPAGIDDLERYYAVMTQPVWRENPTTLKLELDKYGETGDGPSPDDFDSACLAYRDDCRRLRAR